MKLVQLNIANSRLAPPLLRFVKDQQADILCLQELENTDAFDSHLVELKNASGLPYHYFSPLSGYEIQGTFYQCGDCILSRTPIENQQTILLHGAYDPDWRIAAPDYNNCRNLQSVEIVVDAVRYHVLNYYGYYIPGSKQGNDVTLQLMDMICDHIDALQGAGADRIIFASDTNLAPDSLSMTRLNATLRNLCIEHGVKTTRNFVAKRLTDEVIDYICVSNNVIVQDFCVAEEIVSDHQPLILRV